MGPDLALGYINAALHTNYVVANQFSGGDDQGAYRLTGDFGATAVLKLSGNPAWRAQIERARAATDHLRALGYPAPRYFYIDSKDTGTFWLEDELYGQPNPVPTPEQITALLGVVELQKDQIVSAIQGQDWSWYVSNAVFRGESGLVRALMQFSNETSALAAAIEGLVLGLDDYDLVKSDIVHGDFGISQILFNGNSVSAVLDWDQAGYGDRTMDLVGLWFSLMDAPVPRDLVMTHLQKSAQPEAIKIFAAYKMLAVLVWHINKSGGEVAPAIVRIRTALGILSAI